LIQTVLGMMRLKRTDLCPNMEMVPRALCYMANSAQNLALEGEKQNQAARHRLGREPTLPTNLQTAGTIKHPQSAILASRRSVGPLWPS
jgi:hypothetical protein